MFTGCQAIRYHINNLTTMLDKLMNPELYTAVLTVLNFVFIILLAVVGFMVRRIFSTTDLQFKLMGEIREFIHKIDKRVIVLETHQEFTLIKFREHAFNAGEKREKES